MTNYPDTLLRGLSADDWVRDGLVMSGAFHFSFDAKFLRNGNAALSICWEDDGSVIGVMLRQIKESSNGEQVVQFRSGIARLSRDSLEHINKLPQFRETLSYEREPLQGNPYHGNLLMSAVANPTQRRLLPALIANHVSDVIPQA